MVAPQLLASFDGRVPEHIAVVLEPAGLRGDVAVERDLRLGGELPLKSNSSARTLWVPQSIASSRSSARRSRHGSEWHREMMPE
jgi:hypothetical protein